MKRLFALVAMLGVFLLTPQSNASDLEKLYPEQLNAAKNLYQLTHAYFNGTGKLTEDNLLSPEMVKSRLRQAQFYHLRRLVVLAVDAGYDLSDLEEFGIKTNNSGFTIELWQYPQWARYRTLFRPLTSSTKFQYHAKKLMNMGLSEFDIATLQNYIQQHNVNEAVLLAEHSLVSNFSNDNALVNTYSTGDVLKLHESLRSSREKTWFTWGVGLLNLFDIHKQRVLVSYLQQRLGKLAVGPKAMTSDYLETYAKSLKTGEELKKIDLQLAQYNNLLTKEIK